MPLRGIVAALDVIGRVGLNLVSRAVRFVRRAFSFQRGEEAIHRGIVPVVAGSAHATGHAMVSQQLLERRTGVLAPSIGGMQDGLRRTAPPDRHREGIGASCVVIVVCMNQPMTRRENMSTTRLLRARLRRSRGR